MVALAIDVSTRFVSTTRGGQYKPAGCRGTSAHHWTCPNRWGHSDLGIHVHVPTCVLQIPLVVVLRLFLDLWIDHDPEHVVPSQRWRDLDRCDRAARLELPRVHVVHIPLSGSWASVQSVPLECTHLRYPLRADESGSKHRTREVVELHCYFELQFRNLSRCSRLLR